MHIPTSSPPDRPSLAGKYGEGHDQSPDAARAPQRDGLARFAHDAIEEVTV